MFEFEEREETGRMKRRSTVVVRRRKRGERVVLLLVIVITVIDDVLEVGVWPFGYICLSCLYSCTIILPKYLNKYYLNVLKASITYN